MKSSAAAVVESQRQKKLGRKVLKSIFHTAASSLFIMMLYSRKASHFSIVPTCWSRNVTNKDVNDNVSTKNIILHYNSSTDWWLSLPDSPGIKEWKGGKGKKQFCTQAVSIKSGGREEEMSVKMWEEIRDDDGVHGLWKREAEASRINVSSQQITRWEPDMWRKVWDRKK